MNDVEPALFLPARPDLKSPARKPRARALTITLLASLGLHLIAVTVALLLLHAGVPPPDTPEKPTEVELVMEEHKGDNHPVASTPPSPQASAATPPEQPTPPSPPVKPAVEARPDTPQDTTEPAMASTPAPAVAPVPDQEARAPSRPAPPAVQQAPTITLQGTDSPSNARAWGSRIIPAAPDAVFHNRPPEYPAESVLSGEHGTVVVVIHVSPAGTAAGVDVQRSSGYLLLDRAVRVAVMRWRFLPAVQAGEPVASSVTMGFVFDYE